MVAESSEEFAAAILRLLEDETLRRRMAAAAIPVVRTHSAVAAARKLEEVLEGAVASFRGNYR